MCLVLESSLRVIPVLMAISRKLVTSKLQPTPFSMSAKLSINATCDDIMKRLMIELNILLQRWKRL